MRLHQRLTDEHIFINKTSKMRNHLAEEVLDDNMYHLMNKYRETLKDGKHLDSTIDLLDHTREIINIFRDSRPLIDVNDDRFDKLSAFDKWLHDWRNEVPDSDKSKTFITKETFMDIISMLRGFTQICKRRIENEMKGVVAAGINSDIVENFFCQQRTICHGSTTNPNVLQYEQAINSTILGQTAISKKSNAGKSKARVQPASFKNEPMNKKKKS